MNWLPFVSRSRFEDLKAEHRELKETHERLVNDLYFTKSGYNIYARFEDKSEAVVGEVVAPAKKEDPEDQGGSLREVLMRTEARNITQFEEKRRTLLAAAAHKMNQTLEDADRAAAPGAD